MQRAAAFWRILHPVPSLLTVAAAGAFVLLAARGLPPAGRLLHLLVIEAAMQFSISAFNDYFDRHIDRGRPDKPIAQGIISPTVGWGVGLTLAVVAVGLSLPLGGLFTLLTSVGLAGGLLYDAGMKYTALSWLPFVMAFPTLPLWAWAGIYQDGAFPPALLLFVPLSAVLVLGIHMADTIPDLTADEAAGVRGLAHRLGLQRSLALCWGAYAVGTLLTVVLALVVPYNLAWFLPGLATSLVLTIFAIFLYRRDPTKVRVMSLLLEVSAVVLAVAWIAAVTL